MISDDNDPADLADFRTRREERRLEQWSKNVGRTPDYDRQIPPGSTPTPTPCFGRSGSATTPWVPS